MHDLWISDLRQPGKKSCIIRDHALKAETLYFGYKASRQLIIYDKNAELGRPLSAPSRLRFEYRYSKGDYTLGELYTHLTNPLHNFQIRRFAALPPPISPLYSRLLFDACRLRGKASVIASASEGERAQLLLDIDSFPHWYTWLRVTSIWPQLWQRINELLPAASSDE